METLECQRGAITPEQLQGSKHLNHIATEDPKNKGQKRKICVSCHSRLEDLVSVSMVAFCISRMQVNCPSIATL